MTFSNILEQNDWQVTEYDLVQGRVIYSLNGFDIAVDDEKNLDAYEHRQLDNIDFFILW